MTEEPSKTNKNWSAGKKQAFRFFGLYLFLYLFTTKFTFLYDGIVDWTGRALGIWQGITVRPNGSGDTTYNYLQLVCLLSVAALASLIWWIADHKRKHYDELLYWVAACLRYGLAFYMLVYGFSKVFIGQFPPPSLSRLLQPIGESSLMGIAWTFMGASPAYSVFTGMAEVIGGCLLFFRRTTVFGSLFCMTILINIMAMNFCYDIPVKLFSSHLLLVCIFIAAPAMPTLFAFFIRQRSAAIMMHAPVFKTGGARAARILLKIFIILLLIGGNCYSYYNAINSRFSGDIPPLYGIYNVKTFAFDQDTLLPLTTDAYRWHKVVLDKYERASVIKMDGKSIRYEWKVDTAERKIHFTHEKDPGYVFTYQQVDSTHIALSATAQQVHISMLLQRIPHDFLLTNQKFRWINEYPFNR